jgi:hypothetical protein
VPSRVRDEQHLDVQRPAAPGREPRLGAGRPERQGRPETMGVATSAAGAGAGARRPSMRAARAARPPRRRRGWRADILVVLPTGWSPPAGDRGRARPAGGARATPPRADARADRRRPPEIIPSRAEIVGGGVVEERAARDGRPGVPSRRGVSSGAVLTRECPRPRHSGGRSRPPPDPLRCTYRSAGLASCRRDCRTPRPAWTRTAARPAMPPASAARRTRGRDLRRVACDERHAAPVGYATARAPGRA